jgi:hypothetical protein
MAGQTGPCVRPSYRVGGALVAQRKRGSYSSASRLCNYLILNDTLCYLAANAEARKDVMGACSHQDRAQSNHDYVSLRQGLATLERRCRSREDHVGFAHFDDLRRRF